MSANKKLGWFKVPTLRPGDKVYYVDSVPFVGGSGSFRGWVRECAGLRNGTLGTLLLPIEGDEIRLSNSSPQGAQRPRSPKTLGQAKKPRKRAYRTPSGGSR